MPFGDPRVGKWSEPSDSTGPALPSIPITFRYVGGDYPAQGNKTEIMVEAGDLGDSQTASKVYKDVVRHPRRDSSLHPASLSLIFSSEVQSSLQKII